MGIMLAAGSASRIIGLYTKLPSLIAKLLSSRKKLFFLSTFLSNYTQTGPVIIVGGYTGFGTIWTFSITTVVMLTPMLLLYFLRTRIVGDNPKKDNLPMNDLNTP
jgi:hypothetical protein